MGEKKLETGPTDKEGSLYQDQRNPLRQALSRCNWATSPDQTGPTAGQFGAQFVHEISPWCGVVVN